MWGSWGRWFECESVEKLLKLILIREDVDASQVESIITEGEGEWPGDRLV